MTEILDQLMAFGLMIFLFAMFILAIMVAK